MAHNTVPLNLADLDDGEALKRVDDAMKAAARDLADRPHAAGVRKVSLTIELHPDEDADIDAVLVTPTIAYKVQTSVPATKGRTTRGILQPDGDLVINRDDREHPNQQTLDGVTAFPKTANN